MGETPGYSSQSAMTKPRPLILLDPHPRPLGLIFDAATKARLEELDLEQVLKGLPPQRCQRAQWETVAKIRSKPVS